MIIYRGSSDTEDALLTLAGTLAFIVAMVPTRRPPGEPANLVCGRFDLPRDYQVEHGVTNNVWAVVIALFVAQILTWWQYRRTKTAQRPSCGGAVVRVILWTIMGLGLVALIFFEPEFISLGHGVAAVTMFLAIIATVWINAFLNGRQVDTKSHKQLYRFAYRFIAVTMFVTVLIVVASHLVLREWILVVEALLILEFTIYWVDPDDRTVEHAQPHHAPPRGRPAKAFGKLDRESSERHRTRSPVPARDALRQTGRCELSRRRGLFAPLAHASRLRTTPSASSRPRSVSTSRSPSRSNRPSSIATSARSRSPWSSTSARRP